MTQIIRTQKLEFTPRVEIGYDWIVLGDVRILENMDWETFDKEITELVKKLIDKQSIQYIYHDNDEIFHDIYYDEDYHVASIVFAEDKNKIGDVLVKGANRIVENPYVYEGEEFELYIQLRTTTE